MKTQDNNRVAPSTHTPRPQGPSWRGFFETFIIGFVTVMITNYIKDAIIKSDNFYVQLGVHASIYTLFNFVYRKVVRMYSSQ